MNEAGFLDHWTIELVAVVLSAIIGFFEGKRRGKPNGD